MPLSFKKVIPAVAGVSGVAGFALFKNLSNIKNISTSSPAEVTPTKGNSIRDEVISSGKKVLLSGASSKAWDIRKKQYQDRFGKVTTNEFVARWCNDSLNSEYEDSLYKNVSELCVVPSIKERFTFQNKQVIDLNNKNDTRWNTKVTNYSKHNEKKMPNSELKAPNGSVTSEVIMNWCKGSVEEEFVDENERYGIVENWCIAK